MNFLKHKVTEREMLSEMLDYCHKIISHRRKEDESFLNFSCCISTRSSGVEITYKPINESEKTIIVIRYDERNDHYYFVEKLKIKNKSLEKRIIIEKKEDFYVYFDHTISTTISA